MVVKRSSAFGYWSSIQQAAVVFLLLFRLAVCEPMTEFSLDERPEGITSGPGSVLYVSQILSGKVLSIDVLTGETTEVVGDQGGDRQAWGLEYHDDGYLFVAGGGPSYGGGTPEVYVYNVETGEAVATCAPMTVNETGFGAFMNDVTIVNDLAFITDSFGSKLMVMDVPMALQGTCSVSEILLNTEANSAVIFTPEGEGDWGANGIEPFSFSNSTVLLVAHEVDGSVYYSSPLETSTSTLTFQELIPAGEAAGADGLVILEDKLYVTQNFENVLGVFQLSGELVATKLGNLSSPDFDTPATSAIYDGYIFSTNSRFVSLPDIGTPADDNVIGIPIALSEGTSAPSSPGEGTEAPQVPTVTPGSPSASPTTAPPTTSDSSKIGLGMRLAVLAVVTAWLHL